MHAHYLYITALQSNCAARVVLCPFVPIPRRRLRLLRFLLASRLYLQSTEKLKEIATSGV